jgi:iron-sulfur cluster assembly protein|tara:strand:+ start:1724 stop:2053 length:330 start_codon:yes stop_codon:yes gene_type:complete
MVNVSDTAANQLQSIFLEENKVPKDNYVRVGVKSGGCSGLSYILDFEDKSSEGDKVVESNGINLLIDKKSLLYLIGTTLEYSSGLNGKGFHWSNPNASRSCGCGESFSL